MPRSSSATLLVAACAGPKETVVLLPSPAGQDTAVTVTQGTRQVVLAQPYAGARVGRGGPEAFPSTPQQVQGRLRPRARGAAPAAGAVHALLRRRQGRVHRRIEADRRQRLRRDRQAAGARRHRHRPHRHASAATLPTTRSRASAPTSCAQRSSRAAWPPTRWSPSAAASASWPCRPATASPSRAIGASRSWSAEAFA